MNTRAYTFQSPIWQKISTKIMFFVLAGLLISFSILYVFLVNKTIMNVVARSNNLKTITSLSSQIGEMENTYISKENSITLNVAYSKGFTDATPSQFVSREQSLTFNTR